MLVVVTAPIFQGHEEGSLYASSITDGFPSRFFT